MKFEWDDAKGAMNVSKHGVTFEEAASVFGNSLAATLPDPDHSLGQHRWLTVGYSRLGRLLVVAHAESDSMLRIINARLATAHERNRYESD